MIDDKDDSVEIHLVIDRIEDGGWAVLLVGDDESTSIDFPVRLLPIGANGGDHLRLTITRDDKARDRAEDRTRELLERLQRRSTNEKNFKL